MKSDGSWTYFAPDIAYHYDKIERGYDLLIDVFGADHGGFPLKERIGFRLKERGYEVVDCGTDSPESVDYPVFAAAVARRVADGSCSWGIVVDGAGIGSAMVANKVPGVRAALCYDLSTARNSREHNHANVLTLGAGLIGDGLAWQIVQEWLAVPWGGDRHARRVAMITAQPSRLSWVGACPGSSAANQAMPIRWISRRR